MSDDEIKAMATLACVPCRTHESLRADNIYELSQDRAIKLPTANTNINHLRYPDECYTLQQFRRNGH